MVALLIELSEDERNDKRADREPHQRLHIRLKQVTHLGHSIFIRTDKTLNRIEYDRCGIAKTRKDLIPLRLTILAIAVTTQ